MEEAWGRSNKSHEGAIHEIKGNEKMKGDHKKESRGGSHATLGYEGAFQVRLL